MSRMVAVLVSLLFLAPPAAAASAPDWAAEAAARPVPPGAEQAALMHLEETVQVPARGPVAVTVRQAVRVLSRAGADAATVEAFYLRGESEVKNLRAWTLAADGSVVRRWNRKDATDLSDVQTYQLYSEYRYLRLTDAVIRPGETFACEWETENKPLFAQWSWRFRLKLACAFSRFRLELPPGLEPLVQSADLDSVSFVQEPGAWTWTARAQSPLPREPLAPPRPVPGGFLNVQVVPDGGDASPAGVAFRSWPDVARWECGLVELQSAGTPELNDRVEGILATVSDTLDRIRTLGRFVQGLNYVSNDVNVARGWGYRPHAASEVLSLGYGDCKDKANLLCTMLRAAGLDAWLLAVYSGHRDEVDSAWVSPTQFNHCIAAVRAPVDYRGPLLDGGRQGRLIAFDPTDPLTAFGDLPEDEQGSWGLLLRPGRGDLVRLPVMPEGSSRLERRIDAELDASGRLSARIEERSFGQAARDERALRRGSSDADYRRMLERWLPAQGGSVQLGSWSTGDDPLGGGFELRADYVSPSFARLVGDRLLTYRGALLSPRRTAGRLDSTRTLPIALTAEFREESLSVRLPEGFALDERPPDLHIANDIGRLEAKWSERDGRLLLARRWELRPVTVGPERWPDILALFAAKRASDEATVVLERR